MRLNFRYPGIFRGRSDLFPGGGDSVLCGREGGRGALACAAAVGAVELYYLSGELSWVLDVAVAVLLVFVSKVGGRYSDNEARLLPAKRGVTGGSQGRSCNLFGATTCNALMLNASCKATISRYTTSPDRGGFDFATVSHSPHNCLSIDLRRACNGKRFYRTGPACSESFLHLLVGIRYMEDRMDEIQTSERHGHDLD